jgi:hypothetical protein
MRSEKDVIEALFHESLGHFGLRNLFGEELLRILKQVAPLRRRDGEAMARRYGLDIRIEAHRLKAAEEVLAHLAQTRRESSFVRCAIAAVRKWLRENIPGFAKMKLSDGETIENYLLPARRFVQETPAPSTAVPRASSGLVSQNWGPKILESDRCRKQRPKKLLFHHKL